MSNAHVLIRAIGNLLRHIVLGLAIAAGIAALEIGLIALAVLPFINSDSDIPDTYEWVVATVFATIFIGGNVIILAVTIVFRRRSQNQWIKSEAEKWQRLRSRVSRSAARKYAKLEARVLWIPTVLILVIFFFLPECAGILSHLATARSPIINGYPIEIPLTWTITNRRPGAIWILYGKGVARSGISPWLRREPPVESVFFSADSTNHDIVIRYWITRSTETVMSKNRIFVCRHLAPSPGDDPSWSSHYAVVECETERDLYASFSGDRSEVPSFYRVLQSIKGK